MKVAGVIQYFALVGLFACGSLAMVAGSVDELVDPEKIVEFSLPTPPERQYENWTDWDTWEASPEVAKFLAYYRCGYDYDGRVVYVIEFGHWNWRELSHMSGEKVEEVWKYYEQYARRVHRDAVLNNDQGAVLIADFDDFGLKHYASSQALQASMKMFSKVGRLFKDFEYGFIINVDYSAETFMLTSRPFYGTLLDKLDVYGTLSEKWKPKLLRKIPASQLPPKYGGDQSWRPLPLH